MVNHNGTPFVDKNDLKVEGCFDIGATALWIRLLSCHWRFFQLSAVHSSHYTVSRKNDTFGLPLLRHIVADFDNYGKARRVVLRGSVELALSGDVTEEK